MFVLTTVWYQRYTLLLRSTLCSAALRRGLITSNNCTHTHTHTNDWSYINQRVINLDLTKNWNFIGFSGSLVTAAVWALWILLYLKTVLLLSSVGECKLRTKFCTTWPLCTFWCKLSDRQNSRTSDCNSQFLRKLHSLVCTYTVGLFLCHCLIFTRFLVASCVCYKHHHNHHHRHHRPTAISAQQWPIHLRAAELTWSVRHRAA
jgi:hypothetical protein